MKIALISLGCSKNLVDAEVMLGFLKRDGFNISNNPENSDVVIVNTCAFVEDAKVEAIDTIFNVLKLKQQGKIKKVIVSGCLPQRYNKELPDLLKEVDGFLGPGSLDKVGKIVTSLMPRNNLINVKKKHYLYNACSPRVHLVPRHYAYVKIADGCDNRCSYCVIPQIRGGYKSRTEKDIVKEVKALVAKGVKEINLISQDTTFYGYDIHRKYSLDSLIKKLVKIKKLKWIRLLYTHPRHYTDSLIKVIAAEEKVCKYIDLPIQHINNEVLGLMNRKIKAQKIKQLILKLRSLIPQVVLRTSLIVGFPNETENRFQELYQFVEQVRFDRLGVFAYSPEENTKAAGMKPQIPSKIKQKRLKKIMLLQQKIVEKKNQDLIGKTMPVLIDAKLEENFFNGRTQFDAPEVDGLVYVRGEGIKVGHLVDVMIKDAITYDLTGERV